MKDRLYNKYRPKLFLEMQEQNLEVSKLKNIVKKKLYQHNREYIFISEIGGVGKSTLARIFAQAINCDNSQNGEPCHKCKSCQLFEKDQYSDFISLFGTDYNTVDKVKEVINIANTFPVYKDKYKIILIDEFQRMSSQAQAEFLNITEFGKNRTIFLFTTTKQSSIIEPLQTRCEHIFFNKISPSIIRNQIIDIIQKENLSISQDKINQIVYLSKGSLRDAIKMISNYEYITTNYDIITDIILDSQTAKIDENKLYKLKINSLYEDCVKVLFDLKQNKTDVISIELFNKTLVLVQNDLDQIIDKFLKYRPNDLESFQLFITMIVNTNSNLLSNKKEEKQKRGRNFINNINISKILLDKGFSRI